MGRRLAELRAGSSDAHEASVYVNCDDGYLWLTCGRCDEALWCVDAGDSWHDMAASVETHECQAAGSTQDGGQ